MSNISAAVLAMHNLHIWTIWTRSIRKLPFINAAERDRQDLPLAESQIRNPKPTLLVASSKVRKNPLDPHAFAFLIFISTAKRVAKM